MGTTIHKVRRKAGTVKKLPLYFLENEKKKITQAKRGITHSRGSTLVESSASWISDTPPEFAPKYAGTASAKNGETRSAPRKSGKSQMRRCVFDTWILLEKIITKTTVENVMPTNITALREWVKNMAPVKNVVVTIKGTREKRSLSRYR
jgi:hypothetical protein